MMSQSTILYDLATSHAEALALEAGSHRERHLGGTVARPNGLRFRAGQLLISAGRRVQGCQMQALPQFAPASGES